MVSKNTLYCNIKIIKQGDEVNLYSKSKRKKTFDKFHELLLKEYVANLSNKCMSLTKKEFLELAVLAESLKINHRFNKEKKTVGKHFCHNFLKRHPGFNLRTPETSQFIAFCRF